MSIASIKARLEAATPGPWVRAYQREVAALPEVDHAAAIGFVSVDALLSGDGAGGLDDADLIAHAPLDLELLLGLAECARDLMRDYPPILPPAIQYRIAQALMRIEANE